MMVGTMAEGATSACVRVTPRFPMATVQARTADPHPLARTEQPDTERDHPRCEGWRFSLPFTAVRSGITSADTEPSQ
jgi:hypothetical protein